MDGYIMPDVFLGYITTYITGVSIEGAIVNARAARVARRPVRDQPT